MQQGRGRPRKYREEDALRAAGEVFWTKGFRATSLEDLTAAMGMNRPSIYNAFGNKKAVYRRALQQFARGMETAFQQTMVEQDDVRTALSSFYDAAVGTYTGGDLARGCLVMSTAVTAATSHPEVRADLLGVIRLLDRRMCERLQRAIDDGQLPRSYDALAGARLAQAVLHSLSLRARAGEQREILHELVKTGVSAVLGSTFAEL